MLANVAWADHPKRPSVEVVFAADVVTHELKVFLSPPVIADGFEGAKKRPFLPFPSLPASRVLGIKVRHAFDNLEPAVDSITCDKQPAVAATTTYLCRAVLYSGFIASLARAAKLEHDPHVISPGGVARHILQLNISVSPAAGAFLEEAVLMSDEPLVMTDGRYNGLSSGVVFRDGEAAFAVMGSYKSTGLLVCPMPPDL
jgi:hypothetical protein